MDEANIGYFPPTADGTHITLGPNAPEKHNCVVAGAKVRFRVTKIVQMPYMQALPMNYPGNHRTTNACRDYPAHWFFAMVDIEDPETFPFPFEYQPHISICCHGLKNAPMKAVDAIRLSV